MRSLPSTYRGVDRLNYICLLASELLGLDSLEHMPTLLGNYDSVFASPAVGDAALPLRNMRYLRVMAASTKMLKLLAASYTDYHRRREQGRLPHGDDLGMGRRFQLGDDLRFAPVWGAVPPSDVAAAIQDLRTTFPLRPRDKRRFLNPAEPAQIDGSTHGGFSASLDPLGLALPAPPVHDLQRPPQRLAPVTWDEIVAEAERLDDIDRRSGLPPLHWRSRLIDERGDPLMVIAGRGAAGDRLDPVREIRLEGLRHLIGLPGSGKSTLLFLLGSILARRGARALFLFPSIEVATAYVEAQVRYGTHVGLLFGQGQASRGRHVENFARSLASTNGGFAVSRPVSPAFATTCALAAWASDEEEPFPHMDPPCERLKQQRPGEKRQLWHLCSLCAVCGRQHAPRELATADLWAGHISSTDRRAPALFSNVDVHYFELVARTFDLVVIDEADGAQTLLDDAGARVMGLYGAHGSVNARITTSIKLAAATGQNAFLAEWDHIEGAGDHLEFESASILLTHVVQNMDEVLQKRFNNHLLTTASLIAELYPPPRSASEAEFERAMAAQGALERLIRDAARALVFGESLDEENWLPPVAIEASAAALGKTVEQCRDFQRALAAAIPGFIRYWQEGVYGPATLEIERVLVEFAPPPETELSAHRQMLIRLIMAVTLVILRYLRMQPRLQQWTATGLMDEDVDARPSAELTNVLPENLLGRLSGVRYEHNENNTVAMQYVSFASTPRALLYRWGQLYETEDAPGPAVLLASATSFLEDSPSFHIPVGPDYLLKRPGAGKGWERSRYRLLALSDPLNPGKYLRYSGAPFSQRDRILGAMIDRLFDGGAGSAISTALAGNDVREGVGRKAALVVNSYEQAEFLLEEIRRRHPDVLPRVRCLAHAVPAGRQANLFVAPSMVEQLPRDPEWDIFIFPMGAIGRGVNLVFNDGPRRNEALIGSVFFLTRPHPRTDSLQFLQGLTGAHSMAFDRADLGDCTSVAELVRRHEAARGALAEQVSILMGRPQALARLGPLARPFVADQMIQILQTIGRAMRRDCPAFVYFVDAAWAPRSATGVADSAATSMVAMMIHILESLTDHRDPVRREVYRELYLPFLAPLRESAGLILGPRRSA